MPADGYTVQAAEAAELARLADIERACAACFPADVLPPERRMDALPLEVLDRASAHGTLWTVRSTSGGTVGYLVAEVCPDELYLVQLDVHPAHQRRGLGRALIERAVGHAARLGLQIVTLTTFSSVPWNGPWYRRLGFVDLAAGELTGRLRAQLAFESGAGLNDRVAMRRSVATGQSASPGGERR